MYDKGQLKTVEKPVQIKFLVWIQYGIKPTTGSRSIQYQLHLRLGARNIVMHTTYQYLDGQIVLIVLPVVYICLYACDAVETITRDKVIRPFPSPVFKAEAYIAANIFPRKSAPSVLSNWNPAIFSRKGDIVRLGCAMQRLS